MTPEIRAAAERYRREAYKPGHFGDPEFRNVGYLTGKDGYEDRVLLSNWAATQIHADDDEAIDEAWLKSIGFVRVGPVCTKRIAQDNTTVLASIGIDDGGNCAIRVRQQVTSKEVSSVTTFVPLAQCTTRRSWRRLLAALGATL